MDHPKLGLRSTISFRRKLRKDPTPAEKIFWSHVANRQFKGLKFVKQHGIGSYIVDFCCRSLMLVIEIDGDSHATFAEAADKIRTKYLESLGYTVIRYNNDDVLNNIDGVFQDLEIKLSQFKTSPNQSPTAGEGESIS